MIESVNAALKPAADFTDLLSGESYVTVSSVKPMLKLLTEDILKPSNNDTTLTSDIKQKMCSVLQEKYEPAALQKLLAKACFLDPRYRGDHIFDTDAKSAIIEEMSEEGSGSASASESVATDEGQAEVPPAAKKKTLGNLLKPRTTSTSASIPMRARADNELTCYLQEEPIDSNANPLSWWRENSAAGNIVTPMRSSLKPHKVNMLVFLARNKDMITQV